MFILRKLMLILRKHVNRRLKVQRIWEPKYGLFLKNDYQILHMIYKFSVINRYLFCLKVVKLNNSRLRYIGFVNTPFAHDLQLFLKKYSSSHNLWKLNNRESRFFGFAVDHNNKTENVDFGIQGYILHSWPKICRCVVHLLLFSREV